MRPDAALPRPTPLRRFAWAAMLVLGAWAAGPVAAQSWAPQGAFVQTGLGENRLKSVGVGAVWPCACLQGLLGGRVDGHIEASLSYWNVRGVTGRSSYASLAVVPMFRYRFDQGRSPWFVEAGIGAVVTDRMYRTRNKSFGTLLNFSDHIGMGYRLSPKSELSLHIQHVSNAGIREPNPGENLLNLRYAFRY